MCVLLGGGREPDDHHGGAWLALFVLFCSFFVVVVCRISSGGAGHRYYSKTAVKEVRKTRLTKAGRRRHVPGLLACVCWVCRIQYDGMALHCLLLLQHYDVPVASLSYFYDHKSSLGCRWVEQTRGVLDVDG